ncbi:unnamed protein product, partial [Cyprideis torosa]
RIFFLISAYALCIYKLRRNKAEGHLCSVSHRSSDYYHAGRTHHRDRRFLAEDDLECHLQDEGKRQIDFADQPQRETICNCFQHGGIGGTLHSIGDHGEGPLQVHRLRSTLEEQVRLCFSSGSQSQEI